jgi:hypothetical protein
MPKTRHYHATAATYAGQANRKPKHTYTVAHEWQELIDGWEVCVHCQSAVRRVVVELAPIAKHIPLFISGKYATFQHHDNVTGTIYEYDEWHEPPITYCIPRKVIK